MAFSTLEQKLLALIPKDGSRVSSSNLLAAYYGQEVPLNGRPILIGRLRGITAKAEHEKLPWRLRKSKRDGPNAIEFWIEAL